MLDIVGLRYLLCIKRFLVATMFKSLDLIMYEEKSEIRNNSHINETHGNGRVKFLERRDKNANFVAHSTEPKMRKMLQKYLLNR